MVRDKDGGTVGDAEDIVGDSDGVGEDDGDAVGDDVDGVADGLGVGGDGSAIVAFGTGHIGLAKGLPMSTKT